MLAAVEAEKAIVEPAHQRARGLAALGYNRHSLLHRGRRGDTARFGKPGNFKYGPGLEFCLTEPRPGRSLLFLSKVLVSRPTNLAAPTHDLCSIADRPVGSLAC